MKHVAKSNRSQKDICRTQNHLEYCHRITTLQREALAKRRPNDQSETRLARDSAQPHQATAFAYTHMRDNLGAVHLTS